MTERQLKVKYIAQEANVSEKMASVALDHARGSIPYALDLLSNDQCRFAFGREIREYNL
jgi:hypothetical protein